MGKGFDARCHAAILALFATHLQIIAAIPYALAMTGLLLTIATFFSTMFGGLTALRYKGSLPKIMGYTAGVILGVIAFDLLPEIFEIVQKQHISATVPMVALVVGFLLFHILEKTLLLHHAHE